MNSLPAIALLILNFVLGFQDVSIKKDFIKSEDNYKYISISLWRPFLDVERSSRISASQQATERQKLISGMALHWKQEGDLLSFDGLGPSIETQRNFTDFDLSFEWKIPKRDRSL